MQGESGCVKVTPVYVDTKNPVLVEEWSDLGEGTLLAGPLNPGWGYGKRWYDSRDDWEDDDEDQGQTPPYRGILDAAALKEARRQQLMRERRG